jgi:hypothetical protein
VSLWFELRINRQRLGLLTVKRRDHLDLDDQAGIRDAVATYDVDLDGEHLGTVRHRYGDGAWVLTNKATALVQASLAVSTWEDSTPRA